MKGRPGGNPEWLSSAYGSELALARSVLLGYPAGENHPPAPPSNKVDVVALPEVKAGTNYRRHQADLTLYNLGIDLGYRTPYLAAIQSSNVASPPGA